MSVETIRSMTDAEFEKWYAESGELARDKADSEREMSENDFFDN